MIILRFGNSGRLAGVCETATRLTYPQCSRFSLTRGGNFRRDRDGLEYASLQSMVQANPGEKFLVLDASVDHSCTESLVSHESFKRDCIEALGRQGLLWRCVGFSSGITLIDPAQVRPTATHMLEYRRQKVAQEELFITLECPVFLPQVFTLIGPRTYAAQNAAWAQILRARLERATGTVLNEPHSRRAWVSEFEVSRLLLTFLFAETPANLVTPLIQGEFTLHEIATDNHLPLPAMSYSEGIGEGWLNGDYVPQSPLLNQQAITDELLRSLNL